MALLYLFGRTQNETNWEIQIKWLSLFYGKKQGGLFA